MSEKISVIIPVYNSKKYLNKCITSVLNQSYQNIEVILVDDGSRDGSGEICDEYEKMDNRVKTIHKKNGGPSECRNVGLKVATGKCIGFLDSDDYVDVQMYEILHSTLEEYKADIAQIGHFVVSDDKIVDKVHADGECILLRENEIVKAIIGDELINSFTWDKLYRRELFDNFEFINLSYHEDLASMSILLSKCKIYVCNNIPLYYYIRNVDSISHTLTPIKYYDSYRAYKIREQVVSHYCPEMFQENAVHKFTMGVCALNSMLREDKTEVTYIKEIRNLMTEMKCDRKQIIGSKEVPRNVKLYLKLLSCESLYKFVCSLDLHKNDK